MLTVALGDKSANIDVQVANLDKPHSPDFVRDVAPMIARAGCNAGTCHGAQERQERLQAFAARLRSDLRRAGTYR